MTVTSLSFFLDHTVRGHRFAKRMQGTPDAKIMNKIIFVALLEPQWAPIYTCRGGPWGPPGGFWRFWNPLWWAFCPQGIFNGGLRRRSPQDASPPPALVVLGSVSASSAGRPRERLRLQRQGFRGASPPPALVVPGASPLLVVTGSVSARLQRQSSWGSSPPPAPVVRGSVSSPNCPFYASVVANREIAPLAFNNNMKLHTGCMTSSYSKTRETKTLAE